MRKIYFLLLYVTVNSNNSMLRVPKYHVEMDAEDIKVTFNDVKGVRIYLCSNLIYLHNLQ